MTKTSSIRSFASIELQYRRHFARNSGLRENFTVATASRTRCQRKPSSRSTVEFVGDTYTTIDESWLFITSRSTVTPCDSVTSINCGFDVQLASPVVQQLAAFRLPQRVARSVCGSRASCPVLTFGLLFSSPAFSAVIPPLVHFRYCT